MNSKTFFLAAALLVAPAVLAEQNITKRATVSSQVLVDVSNVQGFVKVEAWSSNEVQLVARLESDKDQLEWEASNDRVRIKVDRPKISRHWAGDDDAELTLKVPVGTRLHVHSVSADVTVAGVRGEQRLNTVSGDVDTQTFDQEVTLRTVSGDSTVTGNGSVALLTVETVSGDHQIRKVSGEIEASSVSGTINLELVTLQRLRAKSVSGNVHVTADNSPAPRVQMESISGDARLILPGPASAEFDIESFSGRISSCYEAQPRDKSKYGPGRELRFTEGAGEGNVRIRSMSGNVRVCNR